MNRKIIVIEGTDGCGKATQSNLLVQRLINKNYRACRQSFPNYGSFGAKPVEALLSGQLGDSVDALNAYQSGVLFAVDRLCAFNDPKNTELKESDIIVLDRYVESNLLYQATRFDTEEEYNDYVEWLLDLEYNKLSLPKPDMIIYLNMPPKVSKSLIDGRELKNGLSDDIYEKNEQYMLDVYNKGLKIANAQKFKIIDCVDFEGNLKSIEDINDEIFNAIKSKIVAQTFEK